MKPEGAAALGQGAQGRATTPPLPMPRFENYADALDMYHNTEKSLSDSVSIGFEDTHNSAMKELRFDQGDKGEIISFLNEEGRDRRNRNVGAAGEREAGQGRRGGIVTGRENANCH